MKKTFILLFLPLLFFYGCVKDDGTIVDPVVNTNTNSSVVVISVDSPDTLLYSTNDNLPVKIVLKNPEIISSLSATIKDFRDNIPIKTISLTESAQLSDSTSEFSGSFEIDTTYTTGVYTVDYNVSLSSGVTEKVAVKYTYIKRLFGNQPPVLSHLVIPDTVAFDEVFTFHVDVFDINGAADINKVYYQMYKPDGTLVVNSQGISKFPLSDAGDTSESGDVTAGDGIYTMKLLIPTGQPSGIWRMDFQAIDFQDSLSNILSHNLTVQ